MMIGSITAHKFKIVGYAGRGKEKMPTVRVSCTTKDPIAFMGTILDEMLTASLALNGCPGEKLPTTYRLLRIDSISRDSGWADDCAEITYLATLTYIQEASYAP